MPLKYHIQTGKAPNRFQSITRSGVIAWEEGCLKCARCVKKDCVYKVYEKRGIDARQMLESLDSVCKDCFRCVQSCPNRLIQKGVNPTYKALGDHYWTPEIIAGLWFQAEEAVSPFQAPVTVGLFPAPDYDAMWTDMSEIVRPTRDGIHGREYISTTVDIGRKVMALEFDAEGSLTTVSPPLVDIPLPIIFDMLPWSPPAERITGALLEGAKTLGTFAVVRQTAFDPSLARYLDHIALYLDGNPAGLDEAMLSRLRMVEIPYGPNVRSIQNALKEKNPGIVVIVRMNLSPDASGAVYELTMQGAEAVHLVADERGLEKADRPLFIKDRTKVIHQLLVEKGVRDQITLIAGGGIAMAEHVAKQIICGVDLVSVDIPLLVAMECRVCRRCKEGIACPVNLEGVNPGWGSARIRNLIAGWHNQLLEILGAMGIREVRRLRGEMGRAMFFEDLEKEIFAGMGKRG